MAARMPGSKPDETAIAVRRPDAQQQRTAALFTGANVGRRQAFLHLGIIKFEPSAYSAGMMVSR